MMQEQAAAAPVIIALISDQSKTEKEKSLCEALV